MQLKSYLLSWQKVWCYRPSSLLPFLGNVLPPTKIVHPYFFSPLKLDKVVQLFLLLLITKNVRSWILSILVCVPYGPCCFIHSPTAPRLLGTTTARNVQYSTVRTYCKYVCGTAVLLWGYRRNSLPYGTVPYVVPYCTCTRPQCNRPNQERHLSMSNASLCRFCSSGLSINAFCHQLTT